jgi:NAD+ kinase
MKQRKSLPRLVIFGDPKKGPVVEAIAELRGILDGKAEILCGSYLETCTASVIGASDFAIVLGGDGSIIAAARELSEANVPVIGVNFGKLGFLAEFSMDEFKAQCDDILSARSPLEKRMMLGCHVSGQAGQGRERFYSKAVNDVFVAAGPPFRVIELWIAVDGQHVASCVSDGLIVSTPTGSTAYNLSAGGPILAGAMEAMVITPICPHSLSFRPIVIDASKTVDIRCTHVNDGTTVCIDGQVSTGLSTNDVVRVAREASSFLVVNNPTRTRWDTLGTKLGWATKPKYENH